MEVDTEPFNRVEVLREWNHIDLLLKIRISSHAEWVIAIENKVRSTQSKGQLDKYRKQVEAHFPLARKVFLFLTKDLEIPADEHYIATRYETVQRVVSLCLAEAHDTLGAGPKYLLEQYDQLLRERFMANSKAQELAMRIYTEHRRAIDFILEQRPDMITSVGEATSKLLQAQGTWTKNFKPVTFLPTQWDVSNNWVPNGWPCVVLELRFSEDKVLLAGLARQELKNEQWRQELFELAKRENWVKGRSKPGPIWFSFFSQQLTNLPKFEEASPDEIAQEIMIKIREVMSQGKGAGMISKVAEMLVRLDNPIGLVES